MQSLHIKVTQIPPNVSDGKPPYQWNLDDLQIIEQFFESRVSAPPYRPNALSGFARMLNVPSQVLKDFIQVCDSNCEPFPKGRQLEKIPSSSEEEIEIVFDSSLHKVNGSAD